MTCMCLVQGFGTPFSSNRWPHFEVISARRGISVTLTLTKGFTPHKGNGTVNGNGIMRKILPHLV